jgi:hypothetical protein
MNILPAARMIVATKRNIDQFNEEYSAVPPVCILRLTRYEGAWNKRMITVK